MSAFHQLQDVKTAIKVLMVTVENIPAQQGEEEKFIEEIYQLLEQADARLWAYRDEGE
jgi:hypothetical protein